MMNWNLVVTGVLFGGFLGGLWGIIQLMHRMVMYFKPGSPQQQESQAHLGALDGLGCDDLGSGISIGESHQAASEVCTAGSNDSVATALEATSEITSQVVEGSSEILSGLMDGL